MIRIIIIPIWNIGVTTSGQLGQVCSKKIAYIAICQKCHSYDHILWGRIKGTGVGVCYILLLCRYTTSSNYLYKVV